MGVETDYKKLNLHAIFIAALFVLAGCSNPQLRMVRDECTRTWQSRIPPNFQTQTVQRTRFVQVPSSIETCSTIGGITTCRRGTTVEAEPYTVMQTLDINEPQRKAQVTTCIQNECRQKYGNADCKPSAQAKPIVRLPPIVFGEPDGF
jgi:hypothetical protein